MRKTNQFMILKPSGVDGCEPDPQDWLPEKNAKVVILNDSGADQELTDISTKLLKDKHGTWEKTIFIKDGEFWEGKTGAKRNSPGSYVYQSGETVKDVGPRNGTIDPS